MIKKNRKIKDSKTNGYLNGHTCKGGCSCDQITEEEMQRLLSHIFIMQRMPAEASDGDRTLIVAAALVRRNGADGWRLTQKGEDLFLDLYPE